MASDDLVYVGGYTTGNGGSGEGITAARRGAETGALSAIGVVAATDAPSFLVRHPHQPVLYAVSEVTEGAVSAWAEEDGGGLRPLGSRSTGGAHPCHVAVVPGERFLVVANYGSGSVALHPIDEAGVIGERTDLVQHTEHGPDPERQEGPHAHMASPEADGSHVRVVDLGADAIYRYAIEDGRLRRVDGTVRTPAGAGPRHLVRGPGEWLYVAGELDATVMAFRPDPASRGLVLAARVDASTHAGLVYPSEIAIDPAGRFLYVANRGPDTISVFALVDGQPRYVTEVSAGGRWPRHFVLWDDFLYVANERSHTVAVFELTPSTGVPVATGAVLQVPSPTCMLPSPTR